FMRDAFELRPEVCVQKFPRPSDVLEVRIDSDTGLYATEYCTHTRTTLVSAGMEPMPCYHSSVAYQAQEQQHDESYTDAPEKNIPSDTSEIEPVDPDTPIIPVRRRTKVLVNSDFQGDHPREFSDRPSRDERRDERRDPDSQQFRDEDSQRQRR